VAAPDYREHPPRTALADYVRCVWTFVAPADDAPQPIAPDGCCELIVHLHAPYRERRADGDVVQPRVLFAGQITEPLTLVAQGETAVVGVRFQPWAARAFLGVDASGATDKRLDVAALHGEVAATLPNALAAAEPTAWLEAVQDYVATRVWNASLDPHVRAVVEAVEAEREAQAPSGLSERQWQRRFKAEVGVSPRQLQSVFRFRRVFDAIERPGPPGWVEAALAAGYFDQPQMARDFRRYLGLSSRQWAMQRAGLAKALTAPETYKKRPRD
jgi:AraC-like DNA-binding protein